MKGEKYFIFLYQNAVQKNLRLEENSFCSIYIPQQLIVQIRNGRNLVKAVIDGHNYVQVIMFSRQVKHRFTKPWMPKCFNGICLVRVLNDRALEQHLELKLNGL